jgi:mannose-6-phosphate isomerase-like protein (cupin superfamily)
MNRTQTLVVITALLSATLLSAYHPALLPAQGSPAESRRPLVLALDCDAGDCPLLTGSPQTAGLRSGFVRLKPGAAVGWHSTDTNEEQLVILRGRGEAQIGGESARAFTAPAAVYIPPATRHNVLNTGTELLEYVYVVVPAAKP